MRLTLPAFLLASSLMSPAAQMPAPGSDNTAKRDRMEQVVASFVKDNSFMGTVLVAEGDTVLLSKGYGQADLEWNLPNVPDAKFRLGSLTKQFTATLILLLQQDGKLNVTDPVSKYLPDAPKAWEKITLVNLLSHTSGIPNFTNFPEFHAWSMNPHTPAEEIAFFRDRPLDFEPGSKFTYSNSNYEVLGAVVEKVSGEKYGDLLRQRIFAPLGMHATGLDADDLILPKRARGYSPGASGPVYARSESMTVPWAAGSLYSTTGDLLLWERGLFGGKVLTPASLKLMTTPVREDYGFGLVLHPVAGAPVITHGGGIEGFNTSLTYVPGKKITVVVLANLNGAAADQIGEYLTRVMLGETVVLNSERKELPMTPAELQRFAGSYPVAPSFTLVFTVEGAQLMLQPTGQPKLPVFYGGMVNGHPEFFLKAVDAQAEFIPDDSGKISSLIFHQGGHDATARRQ
ncbi:MAG: serine hydrolase [Rhodospirillales bacterium]|nr:serine hydrolase [Acetobacter sp.]